MPDSDSDVPDSDSDVPDFDSETNYAFTKTI